MSSRTWMNLALAAVVAGLGLLVILLPGVRQAPPPITLLDPESLVDLNHIELQVGTGPVLVLNRSAGNLWRLEKPVQRDVDTKQIDTIRRLAKAESYSRYPLGEQDPAKFQLDPPKMRVWLDGLELRFGGTDPLKGRRYVLAGDTLHLIDGLNYSDIRLVAEHLLAAPEGQKGNGRGEGFEPNRIAPAVKEAD